MTTVKLINKSTNPNPEYAHVGDAGMDVRANLTNDIVLMPTERTLVPTGLYFGLPDGIELQVRPRSGLAFKNGITVLNTPGTLDCGYIGELQVILINHSSEPFNIKHGERICQIVFNKFENTSFDLVDTLEKTERGENGFGSTGVK